MPTCTLSASGILETLCVLVLGRERTYSALATESSVCLWGGRDGLGARMARAVGLGAASVASLHEPKHVAQGGFVPRCLLTPSAI